MTWRLQVRILSPPNYLRCILGIGGTGQALREESLSYYLAQHEMNMRRSIPFLFLGSIVFFFFFVWKWVQFLCFRPYFQSKVGFSLGGRALSFALCKLGCSSWIALAISFAVRGIAGESPFFGHSMLHGSSHQPHEPQDDEDSPSSRKRRMDGDRDGDVGPSSVRRRVGSREDCANQSFYSESESWRQSHALSSDNKVDYAPEPSAARGPTLGEADQEQPPVA